MKLLRLVSLVSSVVIGFPYRVVPVTPALRQHRSECVQSRPVLAC